MHETGGLRFSTAPVDLDAEALALFPANEDLLLLAEQLGWNAHDLIRTLLFQAKELPIRVKEKDKSYSYLTRTWVPGCFLDDNVGPVHRANIMFIGKMPGREDCARGRCFVGPFGAFIKEVVGEFGIPFSDVYCTNIARYQLPGSGTMRPSHMQTCLSMLAQEIALLKPKVIVLLGADATKSFAGMKLADMRSSLFHLNSLSEIGKVYQGVGGITSVVGTINPGQILREASLVDWFKADLRMAFGLVDSTPNKGVTLDYRYLYSAAELRELVDTLIAEGRKAFAIDCEWGGEPWAGGNLRTFQVAWDVGKVFVGVLRKCGGDLCCEPNEAAMMFELRRLIDREGVEVWGHNLRADALWLTDRGVPVMDKYTEDSMLADHALLENAEHGLEACVARYTDMGRYDLPMALWKNDNKAAVKARGFLDAPDDLLLPYAAADADATYRLVLKYREVLKDPRNYGPAQLYYNVVIPCGRALHEIESTGLLVDQERMKDMIHKYSAIVDRIADEIRELLGNEDFNPRSNMQIQKLLFGQETKGGLGLTPVKTTGKYPKPWYEALAKTKPELRASLTPSVDNDVIEELSSKHPVVAKLRDFRLVDQVKKNFLTPPSSFTPYGDGVYDKGLMSFVGSDGRIRTTLSQMSETGRHKSSSPNLQNQPKKQEAFMKKAAGEELPGIRSCFVADPGWVLVETDYKSAEIYTLGNLSGCERLLRDADGDLHSRGAVERFGAPKWDGFEEFKPPSKEWTTEFEPYRIGSKAIVFG